VDNSAENVVESVEMSRFNNTLPQIVQIHSMLGCYRPLLPGVADSDEINSGIGRSIY